MKCPRCGKNAYSHAQRIDKTKTKITRYYGCKYCNRVFCTLEKIIEDGTKQNE